VAPTCGVACIPGKAAACVATPCAPACVAGACTPVACIVAGIPAIAPDKGTDVELRAEITRAVVVAMYALGVVEFSEESEELDAFNENGSIEETIDDIKAPDELLEGKEEALEFSCVAPAKAGEAAV